MADGAVDVLVRFIGDASKLRAEADKVEGMGAKMGAVGKKIAVGLGAAFVVSQAREWVDAASEAQKVSATLAQTLKNAGDASGTWAKHAEKLAGSLMKQTGVDDEVIKGGQAILATFHEVGGAVGQTQGIFDRATAAAVDLSAAGFGSVDSSAQKLGKALQDPIKGMAALSRAGVTFTDAQKDQITALVKQGDLLGAQKLLLAEVEGQVKGTAAASVTATDKMNIAWGETKESLGAALLPVLEKLTPVLVSLAGFIQDNADILVPMAGIIMAVVAAQWAWNIAMAANPIGLIVIGIAALVAAIVVLIRNWDKVAAVAVAAWNWILDAARSVFNWIKQNWPLIVAILTGPVGIAVAGIVKNWDKIKEGAQAVIDAIKGFAGRLYDIGRDWMNQLARGIASAAGAVLDKAKSIAKKAIDFLNPFNSPQTRAFYTGQQVMTDYVRGIESRRNMVNAALGFAGAPGGGSDRRGGGSITVNVNGWNGSRVGLGRDVRAALHTVDRWSR